MKNKWPLMATVIEDKFLCASVCLYVEETTFVKQSDIEKGWPLTATFWKEIFPQENECLYVEKTTYAKQSKMKKWWPLTTTRMEGMFFMRLFICRKNHI